MVFDESFLSFINHHVTLLVHPCLGSVSAVDHDDSLPDAQHDSGSNSTVEPRNTVVLEDIPGCTSNSHFVRPAWCLDLALHFNADDFNGLVPG